MDPDPEWNGSRYKNKKIGIEVCAAAGPSTLCLNKNDTNVTHYRFNPHQQISIIFGRDVAERVCY